MGFPKQEYWSGLLYPYPGNLSKQGIEPRSPALQADSLSTEPPGKSLPVFTSSHNILYILKKKKKRKDTGK